MELQRAEQLKNKILTDPFFGECVEFSLDKMGDLKNTTVLDIGCGAGDLSVFFATQGASVIGIDKRQSSVDSSSSLANLFNVDDNCLFVRGHSESLPIQPKSVDVIFSKSTIQYMDRQQVLDEYLRIIKPKGILILIENLPHNPFINLYRRYRRKTSNTPEEVKYVNSIRGYITLGEIDIFAENFLHSEHREFHFSRMVTIYLRAAFQANSISMKLDTLLSNLDKKLFSVFPFLKRFAWFTALYCEQKKNV